MRLPDTFGGTFFTLLAVLLAAMQHMHGGMPYGTLNTPTGTTIGVGHLADYVSVTGGAHLQTSFAVPHDTSTQLRNALTWRIVVPARGLLTPAVRVHHWKPLPGVQAPASYAEPRVNVVRTGSFGFRPMATITLMPWKTTDGMLWVADSCTIDVRWQEALVVDTHVPDGFDAVNAGYTPRSVQMAPKHADHIQAGDPAAWYDPSQPHVRIRTSRDAIAFVTGDDAIRALATIGGRPLPDLAMFVRGFEEPIAIVDADGSGTLTATDTVWFQGRRAQGDTTWLDRYDTVSVHMLTTRQGGERLRLAPLENAGAGTAALRLQSVTLHEHMELDTGYYHLGNASDLAYSDYNSDWAPFEGYYWHRLRASKQASTSERFVHTFWCVPAPGAPITVSAQVVTTTDVKNVAPDNRADMALNGTLATFFEVDGIGQQNMALTLPAGGSPYGVQSMRLYGTGIASQLNNDSYFSETLIDFLRVDGQIRPILDRGTLRGSLQATTEPSVIEVSHARTSRVWVLDTTNHRFSAVTLPRAGVAIVAGLSPVDMAWPTTPWNRQTFRASVRIDDGDISIPNVGGVAVVWKTVGGTIEQLAGLTADAASNHISTLSAGTACAVVVLPGTGSAGLSQTVAQKLLVTPSGGSYIACGVVGNVGSVSQGDGPALGVSGFFASAAPSPSYAGDVWFAAGAERTLFVADASGIEHGRAEPSRLANLSADQSRVDYLVITHSIHAEQARRLADFRAARNGVATRVVNIDAIYDEYGAGTQSPEALRNYMRHVWMTAPEPKPRYAVFVGNASWDPRLAVRFGNVDAALPSQIITYGRPSSDYWFGLLDDYTDVVVPEMIVGRLPVITASDSRNLVDKIIYSDTVAFQPWMRKWQFVGGGDENEGLCDFYATLLDDRFGTGVTFTDPPFCMDTSTLCRYTAGSDAGYIIKTSINGGLQWMNYVGHGATTQFDITGFNADELQNEGRYGILATYACQTGAFSNPSVPCKNAEYLTAANKGFAAAVGGTGWEYTEIISGLHYYMHSLPREGARTLGPLIYNVKRPNAENGSQDGVNTAMQYSILGDPLTRIRMDTIPDVYVRPQDVRTASEQGDGEITDDDSLVVLTVVLNNAGTGTDQPFTVRIHHTVNGVGDSMDVTVGGICKSTVVRCTVRTRGIVGEHALRIVVDPEHQVRENPRANVLNTLFTVYARTLQPLQPHAHGILDASRPFVRVVDPLYDVVGAAPARFVLSEKPSTTEGVVMQSADADVHRDFGLVDWTPSIPATVRGAYWIGAWTINPVSNLPSAVLWIPVQVVGTDTNASHTVVQQGARLQRLTPEQLTYDDVKATTKLFTKDVPLYVVSSGRKTENLATDPTAVVKIGAVTYLFTGYYRGINVVVVPPGDSVPSAVRWYDTWIDPNPPTTNGLDGYAPECLKFLYDSVRTGDRVILLACDESFSAFLQRGLIDSLRRVVKDMGSRYADSLAESSSWILVGAKGIGAGNGEELWKSYQQRDSMVRLNSTFPVWATSGTTATDWVGPMRRFTGAQGIASGDSTICIIEARRADGSTYVVDTLDAMEWSTATASTEDARFVRVTTTMINPFNDRTNVPTSTGALIRYEPADEWLIQPDGVTLPTDPVLRGDTLMATVTIRNARTDQTAPATDVALTATPLTGNDPVRVSFPTEEIEPDESFSLLVPLSSGNLASQATITATVDPRRTMSESYLFNNTRTGTARVREDTTRPRIMIVADGDTLENNDYVLATPDMEVLLLDDSPLPIADASRLTVFVNGTRIRENSTQNYRFLPTSTVRTVVDLPDVRAALTFTHSLVDRHNTIIVRASDASGNADTVELNLYLASRTELRSVMASPNPSHGETFFNVTIADTVASRPADLVIYDAQGREVRRLATVLDMGRSRIRWDGLDDDGTGIAPGAYYFRLQVGDGSGNGDNSRTGAFLILR